MSSKTEHVSGIIAYGIKKNMLLSLGIVLAVCGAVVADIFPPLILGHIIDTIAAGKNMPLYMMLTYFGLIMMTGIMEALREGLLTVFGQKITHELRSRLMEKMTRLTAECINSQEPGTLVSRFVGDVDTVENLFTSGIISMFADACRILSILAVVWFNNRGLAIVLVILLPFFFWFTRTVQKNMLVAQLDNRRAVGKVSGHVPETLHNIRTIHNLSKEEYMENKYDEYIGLSYRAMEKTNFYDAIYSPVILIMNAVVVAVVMLLSASGNSQVLELFGMSAGTAVAVMNYIAQIFSPLESLGMEIQTIQSAVAGVKRINEFFGLPEGYEHASADLAGHAENATEAASASAAQAAVKSGEGKAAYVENVDADDAYVKLNSVVFGYDDHIVLNGLSFSVKKGEQVTLVGRTGAGKSTIFKLLLGLYEPKSGEVIIDGRIASDIRPEDKRKIFGYVEQSFHMVPGTVMEQITVFDKAVTEDMAKEAAVIAGLDETITKLPDGYNTICTPELFSQGQWQLLSIARAVAAKPELLLLDEITANLDAETEKTVLTALKRAGKDRTVISISHRTMAEMGRLITIDTVENK